MKLLLVEWVDSYGGAEWGPLDQLGAEPLRCRSVGWLVRHENGVTVLVSSLSGEGQGLRLFARGDIAIPDRCIVKTLVLCQQTWKTGARRKRAKGKR